MNEVLGHRAYLVGVGGRSKQKCVLGGMAPPATECVGWVIGRGVRGSTRIASRPG